MLHERDGAAQAPSREKHVRTRTLARRCAHAFMRTSVRMHVRVCAHMTPCLRAEARASACVGVRLHRVHACVRPCLRR
eukprot:2612315-Pleurochrysis_carterae.AAC.1